MSSNSASPTRLFSIDILKTLAVLLILNHRMQISYGDYALLATGGALGCALFFFISGYCLADSRAHSFKEWMQKRLGRLLPTLLIVCVISHFGLYEVFVSEFMWFLHCLVMYVTVFYFMRAYSMKYPAFIIGVLSAAYALYYVSVDHGGESMYGLTYGKYLLFFIFFLCGAAIRQKKFSVKKGYALAGGILALPVLATEMLLRAGLLFPGLPDAFQLVSPILLLSGVIGLFAAVSPLNRTAADSVFARYLAPLFATIGALSLESYIGVEPILRELQLLLVPLFPFNLPLVVAGLLIFCYFLRVCTRTSLAIISGRKEDFSLRFILKPY